VQLSALAEGCWPWYRWNEGSNGYEFRFSQSSTKAARPPQFLSRRHQEASSISKERCAFDRIKGLFDQSPGAHRRRAARLPQLTARVVPSRVIPARLGNNKLVRLVAIVRVTCTDYRLRIPAVIAWVSVPMRWRNWQLSPRSYRNAQRQEAFPTDGSFGMEANNQRASKPLSCRAQAMKIA